MSERLGRLLLPSFLVVYILFILASHDGRLGGDDHFALWAAAAMQAGDRLNVDLFDKGAPLLVGLSYLGQVLSGSRTLAEIVFTLLLRVIGLTGAYFLSRRLIGSRLVSVGIVAIVALLQLSETAYGAEKVALYPIAVLAAWWYIDGGGSLYIMSAIIATAALLRHDHGLYVTVPLAMSVFWRPRPWRALAVMAGGALLLLIPWIWWVQSTEGLWTYLTSRLAYAQGLLGAPRPYGFAAPYSWSNNASRILWNVAALSSGAALVVSLRRRVPAVTVLAMAAVAAEIGLMRKDGQTGDVATLWIPLLAWLVHESRWHWRAALGGIAVVSLAAVLTVTRASEELSQIAYDAGGLRARVPRALRFHLVTPPIDAYAPADDTTDERLVIRYLYECLRPSDRVWDTSDWFPASYYAQRRPVWHPSWGLGLKSDEASQRQFLDWIRHEQAPVIITRSREDPFNEFRAYANVQAYVKRYYREGSSPRFDEFRARGYPFRLLFDERRVPTGRYEPLDLPCFAD